MVQCGLEGTMRTLKSSARVVVDLKGMNGNARRGMPLERVEVEEEED